VSTSIKRTGDYWAWLVPDEPVDVAVVNAMGTTTRNKHDHHKLIAQVRAAVNRMTPTTDEMPP
jgi:hypothetical protein